MRGFAERLVARMDIWAAGLLRSVTPPVVAAVLGALVMITLTALVAGAIGSP